MAPEGTIIPPRRVEGWGLYAGGIPGFAGDFQRFTTEGITVVVLSNIGGRDLSSITTGVAGFYSKKLVEPLEPVIRDENPDFTSKVKALINDLSKGKFDPALFTSTVADRIRKDIDRGIPKSLQEQGPLQSIELLESRVEPKSHLYKYRLRYKHLTLFATLVVNGDGQVEKWGLAD